MESLRKALPGAALLLLWLFSFFTGLLGIDYGYHWDEHRLIGSLADTARSGVPLPVWYNYPSLSYDLSLLGSLSRLGQAPGDLLQVYASRRPPRYNAGGSPPTLIRTRVIFLAASLATAIYTAWIAWLLSRRRWVALLAGAIFLSSWEVAYHARWIAPDGLLMHCSALAVLLALLALRQPESRLAAAAGTGAAVFAAPGETNRAARRERRRTWVLLGGAAAAAGLAMGAKYYGGLALLPVGIGWAAAWRRYRPGWWSGLQLGLALGLIFANTFLLTTPGAVLRWERFQADVRYEMAHYAGGHGGNTVTGAGEHARLLLEYLALVMFSPYPAAALALSGLAAGGAARVLRGPGAGLEKAAFLVFPLALAVFLARQQVMIVRNYLSLAPFLSVLAALGAAGAWEWLGRAAPGSRRALQTGLAAGLAGLLLLNQVWLVQAARTIHQRPGDVSGYAGQLAGYLDCHPYQVFYLSREARQVLAAAGRGAFPNLTGSPQNASRFIFVTAYNHNAPSNRRGLYEIAAGPYEVNFDYYANWDGDPRLVVMDMPRAMRSAWRGLIR